MAYSGASQEFPIQIESSYTDHHRERSSDAPGDLSPSFPTFAAISGDGQFERQKFEYVDEEEKKEEEKELSPSDQDDISFWSVQFPWDQEVTRMNKKLFGNGSFKPFQREIINATKSNKDVIGLLPTGGGKSLTFQLTAHTEEGVTLIIYPLLSLIANQKEILRKKGLLVIDAKDFSQTHLMKILNYNMDERVRLIVSTPEYLSKSQIFLSYLDRLHGAGLLARFVIDEAHCLVQWGNSFREDYLWLGSLRHNYPGVPILALSATLSHSLEQQLIDVLKLKNPILFRSDLNRSNIEIKIMQKPKNMLKSVSLTIIDKFKDKSGIIYCSSRNKTEQTANELKITYHLNCEAYHAGMTDSDRKKVQDRWMRGTTQIVVATIAFGLGIDKPDCRFVMHICFPKSLENYIQEIGRCGRDGKPAVAILYYRYSDRSFHNFHIYSSQNREIESLLLYNTLEVLEEPHDCLRKRLLKEMGQQFAIQDCKKSCSNCKRRQSPGSPIYKDYSNFAKILLCYFHMNRKHMTVLKLLEAVKSRKKTNMPNLTGFGQKEIKEFREFMSSENNFRRLCIQMLKAGIFWEEYKDVFNNVVVNLKVRMDKERDLKYGNIKIELSTPQVDPSNMHKYYPTQSQAMNYEEDQIPVQQISEVPASLNFRDHLSQESNFSSLKDKDLLQLLSTQMEKGKPQASEYLPSPFQESDQLPAPYNMLGKKTIPKNTSEVEFEAPQENDPLSLSQELQQCEPKDIRAQRVKKFQRENPSTPKSNLMSFLPVQEDQLRNEEERRKQMEDQAKRSTYVYHQDVEERKGEEEEEQPDPNYYSIFSSSKGVPLQRSNSHLKANAAKRK